MMTDITHGDLLHLREKTRAQALLPDDQRIAIIQAGSWISLEKPKEVLEKLQMMLEAPRVEKPPCLLLIGDPDSGKSSIFTRFLELNTPNANPQSSKATTPVVAINCPNGRDPSAIYVRILNKLFARFKSAEKPEILRLQVVRLFDELEVRILLIDELHDALSGTTREQNTLRTAIKDLTNETKVNIAAAGIQTARTFFALDSQMTTRFRHTIELPIWNADKELGKLLATLEQRLPLRNPSGLKEPSLLSEIHKRAEGNLGDICNLVQEAAISAIKDPKRPEKIDLDRIQNLLWTSPSSRRNFTKQPKLTI